MLVRKKVVLVFLTLIVSVILYTVFYFHASPPMTNSDRWHKPLSSSFSVARRTLGFDRLLSTLQPLGNISKSHRVHISQEQEATKFNSSTLKYHAQQSSSISNIPTGNSKGAITQHNVTSSTGNEHSRSVATDRLSVERNNISSKSTLESYSVNSATNGATITKVQLSSNLNQGGQDGPGTGSSSVQSHKSESYNTTYKPSTATVSPKLDNWPNDSFCYDFLENTFRQSLIVCSNEPASEHSVICYGNSHSEHMATCTIENIAVNMSVLAKAVYNPDDIQFQYDESLTLINDHPEKCTRPTISNLEARVEGGDYVLKFVEKLSDTNQVESKVCDSWINETVYFYTAHPRHIYFHFLDLYNLHKLITANQEVPGTFKVVRISTSDDYVYHEFDKKVFPELLHISELPDVRTCFRKIILVPKSYASVLFQCKMHWSLKKDCINCDGIGLVNTSFNTFRSRVVSACSLDDLVPRRNSSLVLISRTPYLRSSDDKVDKFERLLTNEEELVTSIREKYPTANVSAVHFENFTICEQIRLANEANVLLGVHGAGLVHLWWLRDDALAFEMEPYFEVGNPSFKVLSKITGRHYHSDYIGGGWQRVNAEINSVLKALDKHAIVP